jgi:peptidyl-prolyl cis-trans isomerase A (cyclophilin A)
MNVLTLVLCALLAASADHPEVRLDTQAGTIVVELDAKRAPATTANFLRYVEAGLYDGGVFHRAVTMQNQPQNKIKIEVIQAGTRPETRHFAPIELERTSKTGLKHLAGTISMARDGADSATGDFFICIGDQPSLDFGGQRNPDSQGFAAFGHVVQGMDVVRKIQQSRVEAQKLTPPVTILKATVRNSAVK